MICVFSSNFIYGQAYPPTPKIYGVTSVDDKLRAYNAVNGSYTLLSTITATLAGNTIDWMNGLAYDPCTHKSYVIITDNNVTGRILATINLNTGVCTNIGNLGDNFSSIVFSRDGTLYGVTGNGATVPNSLYTINKTNATSTFLTTFAAGSNGNVISYHPGSNKLFFWTGNTVTYQKVLISAPYTATTISTSLGTSQIHGAVYFPNDSFVLSSNAGFRKVDTLGNLTPNVSKANSFVRGMIMPAQFATQKDTACAKYDTIKIGAASVKNQTIYYVWGDGKIDTVIGGNGAHVYATSGVKNVFVLINNGYCIDTVFSKTITINALPVVTITGGSAICSGGPAVSLTGSSGGTSQWFKNGVLISGATTNTYNATTSGNYNMIKTNTNGCFDSSTTSKLISNASPQVNLGKDTVLCSGSLTLNATGAGYTYAWSTGATTPTILVSGPGTYSVTVTASGCTVVDSIIIASSPAMSAISNKTLCNGNAVSAISFSSTFSGITYTWTNNTPSIGLAASGSGNIGTFTAINPGATPITATVTVTPKSGSTIDSAVFNYTGTLQTWTVPAGVTTANFEVRGAQGGSVTTTCAATGGKGARMIGDIAVTPGEIISIMVGEQGLTNGSDAGGGGGTFVVRTGNVPLIVAGGGGGATNNITQCGANRDGKDAVTTTSGTSSGNGLVAGGTPTNGGGASTGSGGGGGGFTTNGTAGTGLANNNGKSYINGGAGGTGNNNDRGGYGGGGAGWFTGGNGGGGGGYAGGATSGTQPFTGGGGGGSYNSGTNQNNTAGFQTGNGNVKIKFGTNSGCSGTPINFTITVNPTKSTTLNQTICSSQTYFWNGANRNTSGIYPDTFTAANGCDSIVTLNLLVNPSSSSTLNITICASTSYLWNGINRNSPGAYLDTFVNFKGCDSIVTLNLSVTPAPTVDSITDKIICHNSNLGPINFTGPVVSTIYTWTNNTPSIGLAASGTGNIPVFMANNSGSTPITSTVTVTPTFGSSSGNLDSVFFNYTGNMQIFVVPTGVTSVNIQSWGAQGGSNPLSVVGGLGGFASGNLTVSPGDTLRVFVGGRGVTPTSVTSNAAGYNGGGNSGTTTATNMNPRGGGGGGASDVRYLGAALTNRVIVAAGGGGAAGNRVSGIGRGTGGGGGGGYYGGGGGAGWPSASTVLPTGGTQSAGGSAGTSTYAVNNNNGFPGALGIGGDGGTEINSNQAGSQTASVGATGGGLTGTSGTYAGNFAGQSGAGGSSYIGGVTSGATTAGLRAGDGLVKIKYASAPTASTCSGPTRTFKITVKPTSSSSFSQTICSNGAYTWNGIARNTTGAYLDTFINHLGCDSIVTLNLNVNPVTSSSITRTICSNQSYTWNGIARTTAGAYLDTFTNFKGCDSIVTMNLIVNPIVNNISFQTICANDNFIWNGIPRDTSGIFIDTFPNFKGCDSIVTLNLTVNPISTKTVFATICSNGAYPWNGANRTTTGFYLDTFVNYLGCDSIVTLDLTVNPISTSSFNDYICSSQSYLWNGILRTKAGYYLDTFVNASGCDSIVTLNLFVKPSSRYSFGISICSDQTYFFKGMNLNTSGVYKDTLVAFNGCDSVVTLNLTANPSLQFTYTQSICEGEIYYFNDVNRTTTGTYLDTLIASNGCKTYVTLNLIVRPIPRLNIYKTICTGQSYLFNGLLRYNTDSFSYKKAAPGGCDSIITLYLTVTPPSFNTISHTMCAGKSYLFNGINRTFAGLYTAKFINSNGCDSTVTLNLIFEPSPNNTIKRQANKLIANQAGATYQWLDCNAGKAPIAGATSQIFTPNQNGSYAVALTLNNCSDTSVCTFISGIVGIDQINRADAGIKIYPNPSQGNFMVEADKAGTFFIINEIGQTIQTFELNADNRFKHEVIDLSSGIYFIHSQDNPSIGYQKIVVTR